MSTTTSRTGDESLSAALAGLLGHLRGCPDGPIVGTPGETLSGDAERFVGSLAQHLRYSEETLFPALRDFEPGSACDLGELEEEHRLLHVHARELALRIRAGDRDAAYWAGRVFLAVLLDHLHREAEDVDRFVRSLDGPDARRLSAALLERRRPAAG